MRSSHSLSRLSVAFSDRHAVADAGLLLPATLAKKFGLRALCDEHVDLGDAPGAGNVGVKGMTLIFSALAGGRLDRRCEPAAGGFDRGRARLRGAGPLHRGHLPAVLHLGPRPAARRRLRASARPRVGRRRRTGRSAPHHRPGFHHLRNLRPEESRGSRFCCYTHVRGYHSLLAVAAGTGEVLHARLRGSPAHASRDVSRFIAQTVQRVREAGARGEITLGADSGFCSHKVVRACRRRDVRFSITIPLHKRLHQTIAALPEEAWTAIPYVLPGAGVAELPYTTFGKKGTPVSLIVRRVPPNPGSQLALFSACGYHAFICDRKGDTLYLEQDHRRHAEIENVIRDLKYGAGLNHLPSGKFGATAAWLAFQVMGYNVGLWVNSLGLHGTPLWMNTLRHRFLALPGRLTRSARRFFGGPKAASACLALEKNPVAPVPPLLEPCIGRPAASPQSALSRRWPPSASGKSIARSREGRPVDSG